MAVAGRVAIVPKGDYNPETVYKKLDLVRYGLDAYVARKASTGEIPYPEDKEFWMLMVSGQEGIAEKITYDNTLSGLTAEDVQSALDELANMLKEKYVKRTDYAVAPTEDSPGMAGIVQPDGKTIKVSEDGKISGAATGFTGTRAEYESALAAGEIEEGMQVNITDDYQDATVVDSELSEDSTNPVQNKVITAALNETNTKFGGITFSVTVEGLVRASWEEQEGE